MNISFLQKFVIALFLSFGAVLLAPQESYAASAFFDILPEKNPIGVGSETDVSVFLNTNSNNISLARIVLTFDPAIVQVTDAKYSDLFCTYPDDDASFLVDNNEGTVKVTGFCETAPVNNTEFELFVKITFKGRKAGRTDIEAAFSNAGGVNESAAYDDKSPPQNVMTSEPSKISFGVGTTTSTPNTAIERDWILYAALVMILIGVGAFVYLQTKQSKTAIKK